MGTVSIYLDLNTEMGNHEHHERAVDFHTLSANRPVTHQWRNKKLLPEHSIQISDFSQCLTLMVLLVALSGLPVR